MAIITIKIKEMQEREKISLKQLAKLVDYDHGGLGNMINAKISFPQKLVKKLLPILEVSKEEFYGWIVADKYQKEFIGKAVNASKNKRDKKESLVKQNINGILKERSLSQTAFGKIIGYPQSTLNCAINGKESLSDNLTKKISDGLEIPEDEIQAWVLADKYSLKTLEQALTVE